MEHLQSNEKHMLVIRSQQMEILGRAVIRQFEDQMAAHVRERFPDSPFAADDDTLRNFVLDTIKLAKTFGIEQQFDLRRFIEFRAEYGANFHRLDWASKILADPTLSGCGKMEQIDDYSLYVLR